MILGYYQKVYKPKKLKNELNVLKLAINPIKTRDPIFSEDIDEKIEVSRVYETLYTPNPFKNHISYMPLLASDLPVFDEERMAYKIKIKENIFFHPNKCFSKIKIRNKSY